MSGVGLDWYKRQPAAYLKDTQGLSTKEHAVYAVVLDLIYSHGGAVNNDPKWISGWFSDMGASAVRGAIASLVDRSILIVDGGFLTQKRAKTEAKTKQNQRETAQKNGRIGGERSAKTRREINENNDLSEAVGSSQTQAEKRREEIEKKEDTIVSLSDRDIIDAAFDDWNAIAQLNGWPKVKSKTKARQVALRARLKEADGIEGWRKALGRAVASPFLSGSTHHNFQNTFDFITKQANFAKLLEGNYDERKPTSNPRVRPNQTASPHSTLFAAARSVGGGFDGGSPEPSGDMRDITPASGPELDDAPGGNSSVPLLRPANWGPRSTHSDDGLARRLGRVSGLGNQ